MTDTTRVSRKNVSRFAAAALVGAAALYTIAPASSLTPAPDDERVTETRDVDTFTKIELLGAAEMEIVAGEEQSLEVSVRGRPVEQLKTYVENGTLVIDMEEMESKRKWGFNVDVDIKITMATLELFDIRGAVDADIRGIDSEELEIDIRGAGDIDLRGKCGKVTVDIKGAGDVDADKLECADAEVNVRGAGSASVYASESVDAEVSGVGSISVYGEPEKVRKNVGGFGTISIKD